MWNGARIQTSQIPVSREFECVRHFYGLVRDKVVADSGGDGRLSDGLIAQPELQGRVFEAVKPIKPTDLVSEGRVRGGGIHKVEPKELAQISARFVLESIDAQLRVERQERLFA